MRNLTTAVFAISILASPILTWAQGTPTNFDGRYRGVSNQVGTVSNAPCRIPAPNPVPPPLIIVNGHAQTQFGAMEGTVGPQGALVMKMNSGQLFQGNIDARGTATGQVAGSNCYWRLVWQKQGPVNAPAR